MSMLDSVKSRPASRIFAIALSASLAASGVAFAAYTIAPTSAYADDKGASEGFFNLNCETRMQEYYTYPYYASFEAATAMESYDIEYDANYASFEAPTRMESYDIEFGSNNASLEGSTAMDSYDIEFDNYKSSDEAIDGSGTASVSGETYMNASTNCHLESEYPAVYDDAFDEFGVQDSLDRKTANSVVGNKANSINEIIICETSKQYDEWNAGEMRSEIISNIPHFSSSQIHFNNSVIKNRYVTKPVKTFIFNRLFQNVWLGWR